MFDFQPNPTFEFPVKVQMPQKDGTFIAQIFTATWQVADAAELKAAQDKEPARSVEILLQKCLKGWSDLAVNGTALPYTPENVLMLAAHPLTSPALTKSYWAAVSGALTAKN